MKQKTVLLIISVFVMVGFTDCTAMEQQNMSEWQQNHSDVIPYQIEIQGISVSIQSNEEHHILHAKDGFKIVLTPDQSDIWNMESVSVLGIMFRNTGPTEMTLDLMLCNDGATGWSNSSLGRTIVKAGEEMPLAVALGRRSDYSVDPAYLRMSGLPNGHFSHWHTIDPTRVRSLVITCGQKGEHAFEVAQMFPLQKIDNTHMGDLPFIDKYGQYIHKEWPGKVHSDDDFKKSITAEKNLEKELGQPTGFSRYGGWKNGPKFEATGFFRTEKYKDRWWFVDPEGYLFWSYGVTCVGIEFAAQTPLERNTAVFQNLPAEDDKDFGQFYSKRDVEHNYALLEDVPHYEFTMSNLYRKYGNDWKQKYIEQDVKRLRYCHLNTIGAWSDNEVVAQKKVPYAAMIHYEYAFAAQKLPDPLDPETRAGLRKEIYAYPVNFRNDPWCLGAFVNNELHWRNHAFELVADILGYDQRNARVKKETTEVKKVFRNWLKEKYTTIETFNEAWKTQFTEWDDLLKATDTSLFRNADRGDCSALTTLFADAFFKMVKEELTSYSPNILYLGCRFNVAPPEVIKTLGNYAEVISANIYSYNPQVGRYGVTEKPVLISEYHFVDVGGSNLGGGLRSAQNSEQQGRQLSAYIAEAVNHPQIIGAHWFQWRDQNVGGRYDGENYDVGFFDVADMPNEELIRAAAESGRSLYNCLR